MRTGGSAVGGEAEGPIFVHLGEDTAKGHLIAVQNYLMVALEKTEPQSSQRCTVEG